MIKRTRRSATEKVEPKPYLATRRSAARKTGGDAGL